MTRARESTSCDGADRARDFGPPAARGARDRRLQKDAERIAETQCGERLSAEGRGQLR